MLVIPCDLSSAIDWDLVSQTCRAFPEYTVAMIGQLTDADFTLPTEPNFRWVVGGREERRQQLCAASCALLPFAGDGTGFVDLPREGRADTPVVEYVPGRYIIGGPGITVVRKRADWIEAIRIALGLAEAPAELTQAERIARVLKEQGMTIEQRRTSCTDGAAGS